MGLITGYKEITGTAGYFLEIRDQQAQFSSNEIRDPVVALRIFKSLSKEGLNPRVTRKITYIDNGFIVKEPEFMELDAGELEEIVNSGEIPKISVPIVESSYRC